MDKFSTTAGVDTAKDKLDVAITDSAQHWQFENAPAGWRAMVDCMLKASVRRIGIEASGGYERGAVRTLRKAGFEVLLIQPMQVKAFARLHLKRAKNDRLDAALIAAFAATIDAPKTFADERLEDLADHLTFVEQIEEDIRRHKVRLEHVPDGRLKRMVEADIKRLTMRRAAELERIASRIECYDDLARRLTLIESVPGIGRRTALSLTIRMPELGAVTREQAAALAGLAPFDDDSGKRTGNRHIAGGRGRVRRALYAAALPAAFRWNANLKALYRRLIGRGKCHKAALVACARKLLCYANAVLTNDQPWTEKTTAG